MDEKLLLKEEALKRMKYLGLSEKRIDAFKQGKVWLSEYFGTLYEADENLQKMIDDFQKKSGCLVYHVVRSICTLGVDIEMKMDSFLYVSHYTEEEKEEWDMEHEDMKSGIVFAYVYNYTIPEFSESGSICVEPQIGGLVRNSKGFDYEKVNQGKGVLL